MRFAALLHKHHRWDATQVGAREVLAMGTRVGAQALGFEGVGRVQEGAPADLTVIDLDRPHTTPVLDVFSHLAYAVQASDVVTTMVDGQVLYHAGEHRTLDVTAVKREAQTWAERLTGS